MSVSQKTPVSPAKRPARAREREKFSHPFSSGYWRAAVREFADPRVLVFAAVMIALRVCVKSLKIPVAENLNITFGFFVNALGAMIYGPVVAVFGAAVSDTLGALLFPSGAYFFPFIFVEIAGSLIFALFLWRARLSAWRVIASRFSVTLVCNLILNPLIMIPYMNMYYGKSYALFNVTRMVKNIVLFPAEATLLVAFLSAMIPALRHFGFVPAGQPRLSLDKRHWFTIGAMTAVSVAVLAAYLLYA